MDNAFHLMTQILFCFIIEYQEKQNDILVTK